MWRVVMSLLVFCWALFSIPSLYGQQPTPQIEAQIERLERAWKAAPTSEQTTYELQRLERSRKALQSGYLYASLYYLQTVMTDVVALQYAESGKELEKRGFDAFEREWQKLGSQLNEEEKSLTKERLASLPSAVRALVQAAQERSRTYYQAGRLYARETTIPYGLHYLGDAKGALEFATWSAGLSFPKRRVLAAPRSPEKEIAELESQVLQAYARPEAARQQPLFNDISALIKFAEDLTHKGKTAAALETYLEASRLYGLLDPPSVQPSDFNTFQTQARAFKDRFGAGQKDESVGQMYLEIVQLKLAASADSKLSDADARQVAVILSSVLPRYFQYVERDNDAAAAAPVAVASTPSNAKVKVTLVRWPYT